MVQTYKLCAKIILIFGQIECVKRHTVFYSPKLKWCMYLILSLSLSQCVCLCTIIWATLYRCNFVTAYIQLLKSNFKNVSSIGIFERYTLQFCNSYTIPFFFNVHFETHTRSNIFTCWKLIRRICSHSECVWNMLSSVDFQRCSMCHRCIEWGSHGTYMFTSKTVYTLDGKQMWKFAQIYWISALKFEY